MIEELYIPSIIKTQINLVIIWLCLGNQGGAKYFCNFDKVSYFWGWLVVISESDIFMGSSFVSVQ